MAVIATACLSTLAMWGACLILIVARTGGHVLFTLDDPYIDLALAEKLATNLHYGLNAHEAAAPASSILFPFLLVPLVKSGIGEWGAAILCAGGAVASTGLFVAIMLQAGLQVERFSRTSQLLLGATLALAFNFIGLASTGLEHTLHVAASLGCVLGLLRFLQTGQIGWLLPVSALAAPLLRYEGASLWLGVVAVLALHKRWAASSALLLAGTGALIGFSLFLHLHGLPWLPTSVIAKTVMLDPLSSNDILHNAQGMCRLHAICFGAAGLAALYGRYYKLAALLLGMAAAGLLAAYLAAIFGIPPQPPALHIGLFGVLHLLLWRVLVGAISTYGFAQLAFLAMLIIWGGVAGWRAGEKLRWQMAGCGLLVALAQMGFGKFGWFSRYEIYALAIAAACALCVHAQVCRNWAARARPRHIGAICACALLLMSFYAARIISIPAAATNVFDQQYQLHRFASLFYHGPVAVNDLGQVSFQNTAYVLDLLGLGSTEVLAARQAAEAPEVWMDRLAKAHGVQYAMIYPENFARLPAGWVALGRLVMHDPVITSPYPAVTFFAVQAQAAPALRAALANFARTLPPHDCFIAAAQK